MNLYSIHNNNNTDDDRAQWCRIGEGFMPEKLLSVRRVRNVCTHYIHTRMLMCVCLHVHPVSYQCRSLCATPLAVYRSVRFCIHTYSECTYILMYDHVCVCACMNMHTYMYSMYVRARSFARVRIRSFAICAIVSVLSSFSLCHSIRYCCCCLFYLPYSSTSSATRIAAAIYLCSC